MTTPPPVAPLGLPSPPSTPAPVPQPRKLKKKVSFAASTKSDVSEKSVAPTTAPSSPTSIAPSTAPSSPTSAVSMASAKSTSTKLVKPRPADQKLKGKEACKELTKAKEKGKETDTAEGESESGKPGWTSRFRVERDQNGVPLNRRGTILEPPASASSTIDTASTNPASEPSALPTPPPSPGWKHHDRYFPLFSETNIFSSTAAASAPPTTPAHSLSGYTFHSPFENALTPTELQALEHSSLSGRSVIVHYPPLPAFEEFLAGSTRESVGWQGPKWGTEGWNGYGWGGEVLPDKDGMTFGVGMPVGIPILPEVEGGKKGKKKGGEDGEEGEDDKEEGEKAGAGGGGGGAGGDAAAGGAGGGGGQPGQPGAGGGKKKKKK